MSSADDRQPPPLKLAEDDVLAVLVGTAVWAVGLVVLLVLAAFDLAEVRGWWIGMCSYGVGLGLCGAFYLRRRQAALSRLPAA